VSVLILAAMDAAPGHGGDKRPRNVTLTGKIVDLHSYMTDKSASGDLVRSARARIQAGVPAALEAADGLVIVGQGSKGPRKTLERLAFQQVELKGRLYERGGLRYIDISSAKPAKAVREPADEEQNDPECIEPDPEWAAGPKLSAQGACCLPDGDCVEIDEEECAELGGEFHRGKRCDEIMCTPYHP
jgi:hypothetical protein